MRLAHLAELVGLHALAGGALHAQRELFLAQLEQFVGELTCSGSWRGLGPPFHSLSSAHLPLHEGGGHRELGAGKAERLARRLLVRRLPSRREPCRACTLATQYSTLPLPLPMRTSSGFLVIGTSGNTRTQIWPPRFTWRAIARRAASISRAVMRARSVAFRPNSPKDTLLPRCARPVLRPLNCLRYLVRFGCKHDSSNPSGRGGPEPQATAPRPVAAASAGCGPRRPPATRPPHLIVGTTCRTPRP
jgi:hypothetical protein